MALPHAIPDGFESAAGVTTDGGWYVAALTRRGCDEEFTVEQPPEKFALRPGRTERQWRAALDALRPRGLVLSVGGDVRDLAEDPDRVLGPAAPAEPGDGPVVAWSQRVEGTWRLRLLAGGETADVYRGPAAPAAPAAALHEGRPFVACRFSDGEGGRVTRVLDAAGRCVAECDLASGLLRSIGGRLWLLGERIARDRIDLVLRDVLGDGRDAVLEADDGYLLHADLLGEPDGERLLVAAELSPRWGHHELIGMHRRLGLWTYRPRAGGFEPAEATANGVLPPSTCAFADARRSPMARTRYVNVPPITPRLAWHDGRAAVAFRAFRPRGFKSFGWDVLAIVRDGAGWSPPVRLGERFGSGDLPYHLLAAAEGLLLVQPVFDQAAPRTFAEEARGDFSGGGVPKRPTAPAVAVRRLDLSAAAPPAEIPPDRRGVAILPPSWSGIAPDPPGAPSPAGHVLLWCDMHPHTSYSKCMASMDGSPGEVARFQRDVLGCRVLTFADHVHLMSQREMHYTYDVLEAEAGDDCIVLYGCEPGTFPDHHTNFYAIDRQVAERLWRIVYRVRARHEIYRRIRRELPAGSVAAVRHFHGGFWQGGSPTSGLVGTDHAADLEIAAEAMQNRGCSMLNQTPNDPGLEAFPANFLDLGARLGLLGGSDHNGGRGVNHYCITGIWADEPTAEGVWRALWQRKTVACQNAKLAVWTDLAGRPMGADAPVVDRLTVRAEIAAAGELRRAALLMNGQLGPWTDLDGRRATVELSAGYYGPSRAWACVAVEADSAYQDAPALAFSTPHLVSLPE